jgi:hypothetical protein
MKICLEFVPSFQPEIEDFFPRLINNRPDLLNLEDALELLASRKTQTAPYVGKGETVFLHVFSDLSATLFRGTMVEGTDFLGNPNFPLKDDKTRFYWPPIRIMLDWENLPERHAWIRTIRKWVTPFLEMS